MSIALRFAARSDVGLVRSNNQDSGYAGPHLLAVADGMGGHAGGDVASSLAIAHLAPLDDESHGPDLAVDALEAALAQAQDALMERAREESGLAGMGTTVTVLLRAGNKLVMAHIGDSRGYLLREGSLVQVTTDHTFVQYLVATGKITAEEAEHHPQRSVIMRVLGDHDSDPLPDVSVREARPGDRWLLCSDGLSGVVSHDTIEATLTEVPDPDACARALVDLALRGGAPDNVTVVVGDVIDVDTVPDGQAPTTASTVVGAAATTRDLPTRGGAGAAAKAARQTARARQEALAATPRGLELVEEPPPRHLARRIGVTLLVLLGLGALGAGGWFGYQWTQTQYYLGVHGEHLAVFRGIPQRVGPLELSSPVETSEVLLTELPRFVQDRLRQTIPASGREDALARMREIEAEIEPDDGAPPAADPTDPASPTTAEPTDPDA